MKYPSPVLTLVALALLGGCERESRRFEPTVGASISAGPLSPPPLAWQPLQLYQPKSRFPSASAYALTS